MTRSGHKNPNNYPMPESHDIRWKRIAVEGTAIVVSILLAIDEALIHLNNPMSHDYGGGVLDAFIISGRLEITSDKYLRAKLASWSEVFNENLNAIDHSLSEFDSQVIR